MKKILVLGVLILSIASCSNSTTKQEGKSYGKVFTPVGAVSIEDMIKTMGSKNVITAKVEAKVDAVCQTKGCWMDLLKQDGSVMRVTFKDYEYFVPKNIAGKSAIVLGVASYDTTSVEMLQHYAEDAGKTAEEIAEITQPKLELVFEAEGVIIK